jgi:hypothetical protein
MARNSSISRGMTEGSLCTDAVRTGHRNYRLGPWPPFTTQRVDEPPSAKPIGQRRTKSPCQLARSLAEYGVMLGVGRA